MKKILLSLLISAVVLFCIFSCRNQDTYPEPEPIYAPVPTVEFTEDVNKSFLNYADLGNSTFSYILDADDFGHKEAEVESIDVYISYNGKNEMFYQNYKELPTLINITASEAAGLFGKTVETLALGDKFTFRYAVKAKNGTVYSLYNNNICNLIRIIGVCSFDAFVLNPGVAMTTVSALNNSLKKSTISTSFYQFTLNKRDFSTISTVDSIGIEIDYKDSLQAVKPFTIYSVVKEFPATINITAQEAAAKFGLNATDLRISDQFRLKFTLYTADGKSVTSFGAPNNLCGANFPGTIVHPLHLPWPDRSATISPPNTSMSGTCSLSFNVVQ
jgi:hypothetical protein